MPSSIVKREKLIGPVQLALIGLLFFAAFLYLMPKRDAFSISGNDVNGSDAAPIGELDLAYLKARNTSGDQDVEETSRAVSALIKTGQFESAKQLLHTQNGVSLDDKSRFMLDFEMAIADMYAADEPMARALAEQQLSNRIELLLEKPEVRTLEAMKRAAELSEQLDKPATAAQLYKELALVDQPNAKRWYTSCGRVQSQRRQHESAVSCYEQAIAHSDSSEIFDLQLKLLNEVTLLENPARQESVLKQITSTTDRNIDQRTRLASAMLANQRPDMAHKEYAQLAVADNPNAVKWLSEAAKWAQASNEPDLASSYIDKAASLSSGAQKLELIKQSETLLVAAGQNEQAFVRLAARIQASPNDKQELQRGITLARQLGKSDQAAQWNQRLLQLDPANLEALNQQIDIALASRDLKSAAVWSALAVDLAPKSRDTRIRAAQIAEWTGNPTDAQKHWAWLAANYPDNESYEQLLRLAELNRDSATAASTLRAQMLRTRPGSEQIAKLVNLYELEGQPLRAAEFISTLQSRDGYRADATSELANLYYRHHLYAESLSAWQQYADNSGRTSEETLHRMELLWRLKKPEQASEVASHLVGTSKVSEASDIQIQILAEIAWRYRIPELSELARPRVAEIDDEFKSLALGKRVVQSLSDAGKDAEAIEEATRLWSTTQSTDLAMTALNLAYKTGEIGSAESLLNESADTEELRKKPAYWNISASLYLQNGQSEQAMQAFAKALELEPGNTAAISGLLWSNIDAKNTDAIAQLLEQYKPLAEGAPELWSPFAIGYLQLGQAEESLSWFDLQINQIDADYNMLLTFADALEYAGRAEPARSVRLYALKKLRPILAEGSVDDQEVLLRQYAQVMNRYGTAEDKEQLAQYLLNDPSKGSSDNAFWREDLAISWLMATQRHEHARMVMARLHTQRMKAPAWQELSLAMAENDVDAIHAVLDGTGAVSVGNHILALRQIGDDEQAFEMAALASRTAPSLSDMEIARGQYTALRGERPRYTGGNTKQISMNGLGINETGLTVHHSFTSINAGLSVDYTRRKFSSSQYALTDSDVQSDIAVTLHHGGRRFGGYLSAGYNNDVNDGVPYAKTRHHLRNLKGTRQLSAELAYNEETTASPVLRLAARQNRASLGFEQALGHREYLKLEANINDINTRVQENRIARGLSARMELGVRGGFGSNVWSASLAASHANNDVVTNLPAELALAPNVSLNSILTDESTALTFGASLSRGGVNSPFPQVTSPRYYVNARVGQTWPSSTIGVQLDAGAGIRVLGGDELSIGFTHDTQPAAQSDDNDTTSIGVNYRYHF